MTINQQTELWNQINSKTPEIPASLIFSGQKAEWFRLRAFWNAKIHKPSSLLNYGGKKHVKSKAKATGQVLKRSYIKPNVGLEKQFFTFK